MKILGWLMLGIPAVVVACACAYGIYRLIRSALDGDTYAFEGLVLISLFVMLALAIGGAFVLDAAYS